MLKLFTFLSTEQKIDSRGGKSSNIVQKINGWRSQRGGMKHTTHAKYQCSVHHDQKSMCKNIDVIKILHLSMSFSIYVLNSNGCFL